MKKILAGIAVLAVAASAQAAGGLLSTWTVSGSKSQYEEGTAENAGKIHFEDLVIPDGQGKYDSAAIRMNHLASGGAITATKAASITFTLDDNYSFSLESIVGQLSSAAGGGVPEFKWTSDSKGDVTAAAGLVTGGGYEEVTWAASGNPTWTTGDTLNLVPTKATNVSGGNVAATGRTDLKELKINGSVTESSSVPEPATMSLLGLGALAMVIRRKLRK